MDDKKMNELIKIIDLKITKLNKIKSEIVHVSIVKREFPAITDAILADKIAAITNDSKDDPELDQIIKAVEVSKSGAV